MGERISNKAAFTEFKKRVEEFRSSTDDSHDVLLLLLPDQFGLQEEFSVREVRLTDSEVIFFGYPDPENKFRVIPVALGERFRAVIDLPPSKAEKRVTRFVDHSKH